MEIHNNEHGHNKKKAHSVIKDIKRKNYRIYSAEEKIRIVILGLVLLKHGS